MNDEVACEGISEELQKEINIRELVDPKITFYTLSGWAAPKTMLITAKVGLYKIMVLTNSGSTHNFISSQMVNMLRLSIIPIAGFSVRVASRETLSCTGKFQQV